MVPLSCSWSLCTSLSLVPLTGRERSRRSSQRRVLVRLLYEISGMFSLPASPSPVDCRFAGGTDGLMLLSSSLKARFLLLAILTGGVAQVGGRSSDKSWVGHQCLGTDSVPGQFELGSEAVISGKPCVQCWIQGLV